MYFSVCLPISCVCSCVRTWWCLGGVCVYCVVRVLDFVRVCMTVCVRKFVRSTTPTSVSFSFSSSSRRCFLFNL